MQFRETWWWCGYCWVVVTDQITLTIHCTFTHCSQHLAKAVVRRVVLLNSLRRKSTVVEALKGDVYEFRFQLTSHVVTSTGRRYDPKAHSSVDPLGSNGVVLLTCFSLQNALDIIHWRVRTRPSAPIGRRAVTSLTQGCQQTNHVSRDHWRLNWHLLRWRQDAFDKNRFTSIISVCLRH